MGLEAGKEGSQKCQNGIKHDEPTLTDDIQELTTSKNYGVFAMQRRDLLTYVSR
jgi:hypothetical protein